MNDTSSNTLVAIIFEHDEAAAARALRKLNALEKDYLIDLKDAVVVTRREDGKIKLKQSVNLTSTFAWHGAFWGALIGLLFTGPLGWVLVTGLSAGFGALLGAASDYGIDDDFIRELSARMEPCCSALFVLIRSMTEDKVLQELNGLGGTVIKTSLSEDAERRLQAALLGQPLGEDAPHAGA
jgi:uncharacterized membrane protein